MTTHYDVIVKKRHVEGENIAIIEFESSNTLPLPQVEAGAHIDVYLPNGMVRQYSLCQNPSQKGVFRLGVLRDPESRGGSIAAFHDLTVGTQLQVSAPKNLFPLLPAQHTVLIGGGIGITPLITMAYQLAAQGASFELHYCGSSPEHCAFIDEIQNSIFASSTVFHFKSQGANHREFFQSAIQHLDAQSHIYTCGPQGFMDWIVNLATAQHFPASQIHQEYFQLDIDTSGDCFEVVAARSDKRITVHHDETILQALAREGIEIEMSCEQGVCGTCMCDVIEGEIDHRDVYFTDEEKASNEQILVCCSRAKSSCLILDI
ncbi:MULTISPECIES: PDR/VanB family oxidoreductase [unclassified Acinetobacter]|uniref:PDR/VanB family oxidoreductase n=1 Tax=unclassified Acinetobacter TaxID=196816 RepID=UPI00293499D6|nr:MULTISPECIES: PDR/VanB family oxidoreductase [unclassified Acinetobacter]WOE32615.1 PDR/VanB family oxidoreductase [Acinetobacter sp. SAAs470]WOE38091.1 PDR/VanB family oxidoreductase [Acinetobacter sp. SAAs474]